MSNFQTKCEGCVFSKVDDDVQVGCHLGRLEKYKAQGKAKLDGPNYIIDTFCNSVRSKEWAEKQDNLLLNLIKERQTTITTIISIDNYEEFVPNLLKQTLQPRQIIILALGKYEQDIINSCRNYMAKTGIDYYVMHFPFPDEHNDIVPEIVDNKKVKSIYILEMSELLQNNELFRTLDNLINDDLEQPLILKHHNMKIIATILYKLRTPLEHIPETKVYQC